MASVGETVSGCTGTGTVDDPYIFSTIEGFVNACAVEFSYVEAAEENLILDFNDYDNYPININVTKLDAKHCTLLNCVHQNSMNSEILYIQCPNKNSKNYIYNLNLYNFIVSGADSRPAIVYTSGYYTDTHFYNCNFAGVYYGYNSAYALFNVARPGHFHKCSFNIYGFDTNQVSRDLFVPNGGSGYMILDKCVMRLVLDVYYFVGRNIRASGTKFIGSIKSTETTSGSELSIVKDSNYSGYNIIDMNIDTSRIAVNTYLTVVNTTRCNDKTNFGTNTIQMQSTDSDADDYIYNLENLSARGFIVGKVLE